MHVVAIPQPRADLKIQLPEATRSWLDKRRVFRVGVGPEWPPIDQFDSAGRFNGLSGVVLDTLASSLGIRFEFVGFADFGQAIRAAAIPAGSRKLSPKTLSVRSPSAAKKRTRPDVSTRTTSRQPASRYADTFSSSSRRVFDSDCTSTQIVGAGSAGQRRGIPVGWDSSLRYERYAYCGTTFQISPSSVAT